MLIFLSEGKAELRRIMLEEYNLIADNIPDALKKDPITLRKHFKAAYQYYEAFQDEALQESESLEKEYKDIYKKLTHLVCSMIKIG